MTARDSWLPAAVIFDIDRTLANVAHLEHLFDDPNAYDGFYRAFHEAAVDAPVVEWVADEVRRAQALGVGVIAVSARPEVARIPTEQWLANVGLDMDAVYLRPNEWMEWPDVEAKKAMLPSIRQEWFPIHAYEDKPEIAALWRSEGIPTTLVAPVPA